MRCLHYSHGRHSNSLVLFNDGFLSRLGNVLLACAMNDTDKAAECQAQKLAVRGDQEDEQVQLGLMICILPASFIYALSLCMTTEIPPLVVVTIILVDISEL